MFIAAAFDGDLVAGLNTMLQCNKTFFFATFTPGNKLECLSMSNLTSQV